MKQKRRLEAKYKVRRVLLLAILLGLVGGASWYAYDRLIVAKPEAPTQSGDAVGNIFDTEPDPDDAQDGEPDVPPIPASSEKAVPVFGAEAEPLQGQDSWPLLLVNAENPLPEEYEPELELITENYRVDARIADDVKRMFAKAREDGISLMICSAYRSVETQQINFDNKKRELMGAGQTEEEAFAITAGIIAIPGASEHHTGLAMDVVTPAYQILDSGFADTPAFGWLDKNAYKYGFILRYPADKQDITKIIYEPWHYRYVGEEHAAKMKASGLCLEEYIELVRSGKEIPVAAPQSDSSESESAPQ